MPDFIEKNWKAWAGSLAAMLGAGLFKVIQVYFPTIATPEFQVWLAGTAALAVTGGFGYALTWLFKANKPVVATMVAQGLADPTVKASIKQAAATLNAKPVAEPAAVKAKK